MEFKNLLNQIENEFFLGMDFLVQGLVISIAVLTLPIWMPIRLAAKSVKSRKISAEGESK